ncbi:unnamed protein product [Ambrosiozyma monospora]|uniref:Unnamed protein product n=1 Tax=Ambrosiozyma monospora TaxID=43982 RepID=A0ACB5UB88_AMBMO|nr:unnamed protein product [Ambrosiozyma monospora]
MSNNSNTNSIDTSNIVPSINILNDSNTVPSPGPLKTGTDLGFNADNDRYETKESVPNRVSNTPFNFQPMSATASTFAGAAQEKSINFSKNGSPLFDQFGSPVNDTTSSPAYNNNNVNNTHNTTHDNTLNNNDTMHSNYNNNNNNTATANNNRNSFTPFQNQRKPPPSDIDTSTPHPDDIVTPLRSRKRMSVATPASIATSSSNELWHDAKEHHDDTTFHEYDNDLFGYDGQNQSQGQTPTLGLSVPQFTKGHQSNPSVDSFDAKFNSIDNFDTKFQEDLNAEFDNTMDMDMDNNNVDNTTIDQRIISSYFI